MKTYGSVKLWLHSFLTLPLDGVSSRLLYPRGETSIMGLRGHQNQSGRCKEEERLVQVADKLYSYG
jgi:hypothetical protein